MAFPTVSQIVKSFQDTAVTSHPVSIPSGLEAGSVLLLIEFLNSNNDLGGHPAGFSKLYRAPTSEGSGNVNISIWGYLFVSALLPILGVERGDRSAVPGGTITLTTTFARRSLVYAVAFAEKNMPMSYFQFAQTNGGATVIDPPNLVYSASAKDVLWWAIGTTIGDFPITTYPTNYSLHQNAHHIPSQPSAICARELNAASENPSSFAPAGNSDWYGVTMGIALDGP